MLDFEAAARGRYVFDLATAVNALCFVHEHYDLKRFEALQGGYESLRPLSLAEWDAFPNELRLSALRFTVTRLHDFFLHPVEEGARIEKDFREFYERLRILRREREGGMDGLLMAMATGYDYRKYQRVKSLERKGSK
jgi:homoserine kinase type II